MVVINLLEALGDSVKEEEVVEGMQEKEHEHDHEEGDAELDEHVWLSLRNASALAEVISGAVQKIDPDNAQVYGSNTAAYLEKLSALDVPESPRHLYRP